MLSDACIFKHTETGGTEMNIILGEKSHAGTEKRCIKQNIVFSEILSYAL
jgi:hypothetical protein